MTAFFSEEFLNDFVKPSVACIKPIETLPTQSEPQDGVYEVTTEEKIAAAQPAQITLTDCLACSGCVTSAETVLVSLQSHTEVLRSLDSETSITADRLRFAAAKANSSHASDHSSLGVAQQDGLVFVASLSPQVRASLSAAYGVSERQAGNMVEQLLCGPQGIAAGGKYGNRFAWVIDTNAMREVCLATEYEEAAKTSQTPGHKSPLMSSACPGWTCSAEKKFPNTLPHLSPLKSPQALTGTLVKSVLSTRLHVHPSRIWHVAIMPCPDKKLEASRSQLTDEHWISSSRPRSDAPVRDVDCVITTNDLLMLAHERGINFPSLPPKPVPRSERIPFPDSQIDDFLFPRTRRKTGVQSKAAGTSGGYLHYILNRELARYPGSFIRETHEIRPSRRVFSGWIEYNVCAPPRSSETLLSASTGPVPASGEDRVVFRGVRCYGSRNIQNLMRGMAPEGGKAAVKRLDYIEVMACLGGCTNGGGQINVSELATVQGKTRGVVDRKKWQEFVDEAYYSMSESSGSETEPFDDAKDDEDPMEGVQLGHDDEIDGVSPSRVTGLVDRWIAVSGVPRDKLLYTSFSAVESDVGKANGGRGKSAVEIASKPGGGW